MVDVAPKDVDALLRSRTLAQDTGLGPQPHSHQQQAPRSSTPDETPTTENMKVSLGVVHLMVLLMSSEADKCVEREEHITLTLLANEIAVSTCNLHESENIGPVIWYENDGKTPVSTDPNCRVSQQKGKLWLVPAKVEDSGHYYCTVRNSTFCVQRKITARFVETEPDLCYNRQATVIQKLHIAGDGRLVCPYLDSFKDENNEYPKVEWYKDCKPLLLDDEAPFVGFQNTLLVKNVAPEHRGNYTCLAAYTHLGREYRISRVIEFLPLEEIKPNKPVILAPKNETVEVKLGSKTELICNATGYYIDSVYWMWNGSTIAEDDPVLVEDYYYFENPSAAYRDTIIAMLNISDVRSPFYLHPFTCVALNDRGVEVAHVQFVQPVPDFQKYLIGVFVTLTFVIICSVFIYKIFKVDIVLWYRDSCYDFLPQRASSGKIYDAYVLYPKTLTEGSTSSSDIFVFKILPEVLEKQFGYKLFIYGRDDYVGEDKIEVMNESIRQSRRLIIILVRDIAGFSWLGHSSEEQIVMYNALIKEGIKVVLVELDKIQDYEKMPESIKFIKQKHGVIRWSGDLRAGPQSAKTRFWKNIRYHMPALPLSPVSSQQLLAKASRQDSTDTLQSKVRLPLG
ncbi:interleukin-1 receptor type 1 isoform X2 [Octodon degus]|uniref:Interleukin-1 receptor type 1 isoform X2 n=1 Tax=Octodon degus TaxID=10160 RepID=A0A6P3VB20_OCTDE|nr:interleukin-1 receptor type 1 isoform X2 [Octodon degus]